MPLPPGDEPYRGLVGGIGELLEQARRTSARAVNAVMTATYWEIGRRIVEYEQGGSVRAEYGEALLKRLAADLTVRFGRGFGVDNLQRFRLFSLAYPADLNYATASRNSLPGGGEGSATALRTPGAEAGRGLISQARSRASHESMRAILQTPSEESTLALLAAHFPLPWSAYVRLLAVKNERARRFYETEVLRGGWSVRQLDRRCLVLRALVVR